METAGQGAEGQSCAEGQGQGCAQGQGFELEEVDPILKGPGVKWAPCSSTEHTTMLMTMAATVWYQTDIGMSAAHAELHFRETPAQPAPSQGPISTYTRTAFKEGALIFRPWSATLVEGACDRPAGGAAPLLMTMSQGEGGSASASFWVKPRALPNKIEVGKNQIEFL